MKYSSSRSTYEQALNAFVVKDYAVSHQHCMMILESDPRFADAYFLLAMIAITHGNINKGLDVLEQAIKFDQNNVKYHAEKSRCLLIVNRMQEARLVAERASALPNQTAHTLDTIGVVYTRLGDHELAVNHFLAH